MVDWIWTTTTRHSARNKKKDTNTDCDNRWCKLCKMIIIIDCNCQVWFIFIRDFFSLKVFSSLSLSFFNTMLLCITRVQWPNKTFYFHVECIIYHFWIIAFDWRLLLVFLAQIARTSPSFAFIIHFSVEIQKLKRKKFHFQLYRVANVLLPR